MAQQALAGAKALFTTGAERFIGQVRTYRPLTDDGRKLPDESKEMATSVSEVLALMRKAVTGWINTVVSKELTNTQASARIDLDGFGFVDYLPATALLNLESRLAELRAVFPAIPTLDPSERWDYDGGQGRYVSQDRQTTRTEKTTRPLVLY